MKYATGPLALLLLFAISACNKSDNSSSLLNSSWTLGTTTYKVNNFTKSTRNFEAYDKAGNAILFSFSIYPTADGNYRVVSSAISGLGPNDVTVVGFDNEAGSSYFSTGDLGSVSVKVISPVLLRITMPGTWVYNGQDSLKLSANL